MSSKKSILQKEKARAKAAEAEALDAAADAEPTAASEPEKPKLKPGQMVPVRGKNVSGRNWKSAKERQVVFSSAPYFSESSLRMHFNRDLFRIHLVFTAPVTLHAARRYIFVPVVSEFFFFSSKFTDFFYSTQI